MGGLLQKGAKKLLVGVLGVVAALVWMSRPGQGGEEYTELDRMPAVAFGGGAGTLSLRFEVNRPAMLRATFSQYDEDEDEEAGTYVTEELDPGSYARSVDVGPDTYVYFELGIPDATVGATIDWTVFLDGEEIVRESERLDEPLKANYAFFVQFEADYVEQIREWME
jgi:hypothetical protein